jgi:hypothetical protein
MQLTSDEHLTAEIILQSLIQTRTAMSYSDFAVCMKLTGPQKINRIVTSLEKITLEDMRAGRPLRACMIFSKQTPGLPSPGFFSFCAEIGVFDWQNDLAKARIFTQSQQEMLFSTH